MKEKRKSITNKDHRAAGTVRWSGTTTVVPPVTPQEYSSLEEIARTKRPPFAIAVPKYDRIPVICKITPIICDWLPGNVPGIGIGFNKDREPYQHSLPYAVFGLAALYGASWLVTVNFGLGTFRRTKIKDILGDYGWDAYSYGIKERFWKVSYMQQIDAVSLPYASDIVVLSQELLASGQKR